MLGATIAELRDEGLLPATGDGGLMPMNAAIAVKEAVLPFGRFHGVDTVLGPEMKSTGEVMGIDALFGTAYAKSQVAAYAGGLPTSGTAFVSVANRDKRSMIFPVKRLHDLGFEICATAGTAAFLSARGVPAAIVPKVVDGERPHVVDRLLSRQIDLVVNTPLGSESHADDMVIRQTALKYDIPCITTLSGAMAAAEGIAALQHGALSVLSMQEIHAPVAEPPGGAG